MRIINNRNLDKFELFYEYDIVWDARTQSFKNGHSLAKDQTAL